MYGCVYAYHNLSCLDVARVGSGAPQTARVHLRQVQHQPAAVAHVRLQASPGPPFLEHSPDQAPQKDRGEHPSRRVRAEEKGRKEEKFLMIYFFHALHPPRPVGGRTSFWFRSDVLIFLLSSGLNVEVVRRYVVVEEIPVFFMLSGIFQLVIVLFADWVRSCACMHVL